MKSFLRNTHHLLKGNRLLFFFQLFLQMLVGFFSIMETFLIKVLVDTIEGVDKLNEAAAFERVVIAIMTGGRGNQYLYDNGKYLLPTAMIVIGVIYALSMFLRMWMRALFSARFNAHIQEEIFYHIEHLPYREYKLSKEGDLLQTATRDIKVYREFMANGISSITWALWMVLFCFIILISISWKMTLVSISLFPLLFLYSILLTGKVRKLYREADDSEAILTDKVSENLASVRIVKAFNNETYEISSYDKALNDYKDKFLSWKKFSSFFFSSSDIFIFASKVLALIWGIYLVYIGEINSGTLVVALLYVNMMVWPVRDAAQKFANMGQIFASNDRMEALLSKPLEVLTSGLTPEIKGNIVFKNVCFSYPDDDYEKIHDVSFESKAGETIAFMGKTGSGKTTLLLLLTRLYDYTSGSITIDGVELKDIQKAYLRKNIVPVLQDPFLFSRTIEDNIKIAAPKASEFEVKYASRNADIDDTIESFKDGYKTVVGEKGVTLSGGQKQRVAIARTLITNPPVLIFDDSLSAVDTKTDFEIRKHLRENVSKATTFIITHRVASAKTADKIIVLDKGRILEEGTHEELMKKDGLYKRIAYIQSKMEVSE